MSKNKTELSKALCQECYGTGIDDDDYLGECENCDGEGFILNVENKSLTD